MRTRVSVISLVIALSSVASAVAQEQDVIFFRSGPLDPASGQVGAGGVAGVPFHFELPVDVMAVEPFDVGEPVTGAPYSAEITTEILQQLADGNRIERRSTSSVARDGEGRVRREQRLAAIGPILPQGDVQIVTINDPVAKVHYSLDAARKVAIQSPMMFTKRIEGPVRGFAPGKSADVQDTRSESLGTRDIEGVKAEGTRTTVTIPAGAIGNVAPIEMVSERWYSPELRTVILSRRSDPRFGETTYRLENIVRTEPPSELFQVPSDFTIEKGGMVGVEKRIIQAPPGLPR
ncbi:MAG TPA: hypothetical protein VIK60_11295 [Vicinamibacterales bacterium]